MMHHFLYGDKTIYYRLVGSGNPVMLVHGFGEDGTIWQNQFAAFENIQLIIPDLPGSGRSEIIDDMSMEGMADCLNQLLKHLHINQRIIVGHSMGGYITLAFAERFNDKLSAFGLFHSTAFADSDEKKQTREKGINFIKENGASQFLKATIPNLYCDITKKEKPQIIEDHIQSAKNFTNAALITYYRSMINRPDRKKILQHTTLPVLFVLGRYDAAVPLQDGLEQCYLPSLSYIHILEKSGHMGMVEEMENCNQILSKFFLVKATVTK